MHLWDNTVITNVLGVCGALVSKIFPLNANIIMRHICKSNDGKKLPRLYGQHFIMFMHILLCS